MNRIIIIASVTLLVIFGGAAIFLNLSNSNNTVLNPVSSGDDDSDFTAIDACDILTRKIVADAYGGTISGTTPVENTTSSNDLFVTTCSLTSSSGKDSKKVTNGTATLLARIARNEQGASNNKQGFQSNRPAEAVNVAGIGDQAYYIPSFNQFYILKGNNWYILSNYNTSVLDGTLDDVKSLAQKLNFK